MREGLLTFLERFGEALVCLLVSNWNSTEWLAPTVIILGLFSLPLLVGYWAHGRHRTEHERREAERGSRRPESELGSRDPGS